MKAITIYQPYASLIAEGHKVFTTRAFYNQYRGPIAIHAAKGRIGSFNSMPPSLRAELEKCGLTTHKQWNALPRNAIIATGELVDVWKIEKDTTRGEIILRKLKTDCHQYHLQCYPTETTTTLDSKEITLGAFDGAWRMGCYAYEIRNVKPLPVPIPANGAPLIWDWEPETENEAGAE